MSLTRSHLLIAIAVGAAVLLIYFPARQYDFVNFDDPVYVLENPHVATGLRWRNIVWAFTTSEAANWHPLTWISLMIDAQIGTSEQGLSAKSFHWTNILLHAFNSALVFLVLQRMTGSKWPSLFVAVLFGLHPLHVESVAWIPERKDVLSTFFGLLAIDAYVSYALRLRVPWLLLSLMWFLMSLMSKQMLVTLPAVLLLFDLWPLQRFPRFRLPDDRLPFATQTLPRALLEKLPYLLLSLLAMLIVVYAQQSGAAIRSLSKYPLEVRLGNAAVSAVSYLWLMIWPRGLAFFYPFHPPSVAAVLVATSSLLAATTAAFVAVRRYPFVTVGWLFYLGTLLPVIGIVQVGDQAMADRYTYVPLLGIFVALAWGLQAIGEARPRLRGPIFAIVAIAVAGMTLRTSQQLATWKNSETLFHHALAVTEKNETAHIQLANHYKSKGRYVEAISHFQQALALDPGRAEYLANLGSVYLEVGQTERAMQYFRQAVARNPNLGFVLNNLAWVLATSSSDDFRDPVEAVRLAERACSIDSPPNLAFMDTLAAAYASAGRYEAAVRVGTEAQRRATTQGFHQLAGDMESRLELYRQRQPYREP